MSDLGIKVAESLIPLNIGHFLEPGTPISAPSVKSDNVAKREITEAPHGHSRLTCRSVLPFLTKVKTGIIEKTPKES